MKPCRECGQPTAPSARSCPTCGILNPVQQWVAYPDGSHTTAREPVAGGFAGGMASLTHPSAPASQAPAGPPNGNPPAWPPQPPADAGAGEPPQVPPVTNPGYGPPLEPPLAAPPVTNPGYGPPAAPSAYGQPQGYGQAPPPYAPPPAAPGYEQPQGYGQAPPSYMPVQAGGMGVEGGTRQAYPLSLSFKVVAIAPQITVTDATGALLFYVKQKAFKLKEAVTVFADREQTRPLYTLKADRVLDFSAQYEIADAAGNVLGAVKRQGRKSFWRSTFEISRGGQVIATLSEENPWIKVVDSLLLEIPVVGMFTGYFLNPSYLAVRTGTQAPVFRLKKQPAFFEGKFSLEPQGPMSAEEESLMLVSLLMITLLERSRG